MHRGTAPIRRALLFACLSAAASADDPAATESTRLVRHSMGETRIRGRPQRVVALSHESTESALALGVTPVGAVRFWREPRWYPHLAPLLAGVVWVGDEDDPDFEKVESLRPDLILGVKLRQSALYGRLSAIGPTVFCETLRGQWQSNLRLWGEALGRAREAEVLLADWHRQVEETRRQLPRIAETRVAVLRFMPGGLRIYHADSFSGRILHDLGALPSGFPATVTHFEDVLPAQLPQLDAADVLFYFTWDDGSGRARTRERETISGAPWASLRAVRGGRAFRVDDGLWNTSGGVLAARRVLAELALLLRDSQR